MRCCQTVEIHHKCVEEVSLEGKEVKNTIVITFAFQVVFTAFNALQNLHSSLHDEESLGNICLAILYGTAIVSSILSPTIIGLIGAKSTIVAAFAAHCIYVLANFYPSFSTMAPAAVALGAFHGPAWTSQSLYISASAFSFSKSSSASPYTILSRFNGFFFAVFATAQIPGNLVTSTIIKDGVGNSTEENKFCGPDDCPHSENTTIEDPEEWVIDITLGFLMACALLGLFLVIFLLTPLPRSEWIQRVTVRGTATSCFKVLMTTNMMLLVPLIFFTAAEHAFLMSAYTKSYIACPIGIHMVGYVMAVYGATTPAFVYIFSHLARIAGRFLLLMLSLLTHIFLFIVLFRWTPTEESIVVIFVIPIVWGVSESILQAQANALIAMLFPNQKEPAFANFHAWRSLGYAITFLNASYMCVSTKLIVCMTFGGIGTVLYVLLEFKAKIKQKIAFRRARHSIVSVLSEVDMKQVRASATTFSNGNSMESVQSNQSHLSFDRVELTDIIMEAQQGWRRDEKGLTLELSKVMSQEHLACSKVTNWYHTGPVLCGYLEPSSSPAVSQRGLPRSVSDGQLHHGAVKGDEGLSRVRRDRIHTFAGNDSSKTVNTITKRQMSDMTPRPFDMIPEAAYEDEFTVENETETNSDFLQNSDKESSVFENYIDEDETQDVMEYRKDENQHHMSESLAKDNISFNGLEDYYQDSLSTAGHENLAFEPADSNVYYKGGIMFTYGTTSSYSHGECNKAFESDDGDVKNGGPVLIDDGQDSLHTFNRQKPNRLISNDHGYLSENADDNGSFTNDLTNSPRAKTKSERDSKKDPKKSNKKMLGVFKGLRKTKKTNKNDIITSDSASVDEKTREKGDEEDDEGNHSDADSNGFANTEFEDNKSYLTIDFSDTDRTRRKGLIPVSENEDVTCIY